MCLGYTEKSITTQNPMMTNWLTGKRSGKTATGALITRCCANCHRFTNRPPEPLSGVHSLLPVKKRLRKVRAS